MTNKVAQSVFKGILESRSLLFKEICESLSRERQATSTTAQPEIGPIRDAVKDALTALKDANLIKERQALIDDSDQRAPIEDFNTYYVTAEGLGVGRILHLIDESPSSEAAPPP